MSHKLLLAALLLAATAASAQQAPGRKPDAAAITHEMANQLRLNDGQYLRLLKVNRIRLARQQEIEQATANDPAARTAQLAELQGQFERECSTILSPSQMAQLQQPEAVEGGKG